MRGRQFREIDIDLFERFGQKIKAMRTTRGMTQAEVADEMGYTRTSITNIERGRQTTDLQTLYDFATVLGVRPEDLLP